MNRLLEVCLITLALTTITPHVAAQSPVVLASFSLAGGWGRSMNLIESAATALPSQAMQKGISVELPVTSNAVPMPDAAQENSLIVSITDEGSVYLGIDPITPAALAERVEDKLSRRSDKMVYIKADARTQYATVAKVVRALRTAGVDAPNLLTAQRDSSEARNPVPPQGLEVLTHQSASGSQAAVVQVLNSEQGSPTLKINNDLIPPTSLQSMLQQFFQDRNERVVLVKADGTLLFSEVVHVIDMCHPTGAKVVLATP